MFRLLLFMLFNSMFVMAAPVTTDTAKNDVTSTVVKDIVFKSDSSILSVRNFDVQKLTAYSKQNAFIYKDVQLADFSLWSRFWSRIGDLIGSLFKARNSGTVFKYVIVIALISLLVFLVTKFTRFNLRIFSARSKPIAVPYSELQDNINEINFNEEINKAITNKNYRFAVRLLYLSALKKLSDKNQIDWQPEKTNHTYINEIKDLPKRQEFKFLTTQFEYVWYGDFSIDLESFDRMKISFDHFNRETL